VDNILSISSWPVPTVCRLCREWIDPTDDTVEYAVELRRAGRWDTEFAEGDGAFFHASCFPWVRGYRSKPHPLDWTSAAES
jgi:hypothetical protein